MATDAFESSRTSSGLRTLVNRDAVGALILAGSIPLLFLHERWQPDASVGLGATTIDIRPSDVAVLVVLVAAVVAALREGIACLGAARWLWIWGAALIAWLAFQTFRPVAVDDALFDDHLISFLKLLEYGLLALVALLETFEIDNFPHHHPS